MDIFCNTHVACSPHNLDTQMALLCEFGRVQAVARLSRPCLSICESKLWPTCICMLPLPQTYSEKPGVFRRNAHILQHPFTAPLESHTVSQHCEAMHEARQRATKPGGEDQGTDTGLPALKKRIAIHSPLLSLVQAVLRTGTI